MTNRLHEFALHLALDDIPPPVLEFSRCCILDLLGVAAAGARTPLSAIIRDHASQHFAAPEVAPKARMLFDGRFASPPGAALAGGMTIDSLDAHDGHRLTKGHAGCAVFPAAFAALQANEDTDDDSLLAAVVCGYEIAIRAGIALHRNASDYHTSGAWVALACAAIAARCLSLSEAQFAHALGIAEYHGPRSQMMRCIDHPTMLKDGSGWGAMAGVSAAWLARDGFTGAPATTVEGADVADLWGDIGSRWRIMEQYLKPHPVCRWAQPAIEAALILLRDHHIAPAAITAIEVRTFHEACRLDIRHPQNTEQAQYSLPFALAAAVLRGDLGAAEVSGANLQDADILRLADAVLMSEFDAYNDAFPARRMADVCLLMRDGTRLSSPPTQPRGDPESPLSDDEIRRKFHNFADAAIGVQRARNLEQCVMSLGAGAKWDDLLKLASAPL